MRHNDWATLRKRAGASPHSAPFADPSTRPSSERPVPLIRESTICRLAARFGAPASPADLLFGGSHSLAEQAWAPRELLHGSVNADGWGVAWDSGDSMVRLGRAEPVWYDPDARPLLQLQSGRSILGVLRNATPGLPVDASGLLPVVQGRYAFALNGFVPRFRTNHMRDMRRGLSDEGYARLSGVSDAETLFLLLVDALEAGVDPIEGMLEIRSMVADRLEDNEVAPLTMVLTEPSGIHALHSSARGAVNSLWLHPEGGPVPGGALIASEPLTNEGWSRIPEHATVRIDGTGAVIEEVGPEPT